MSALFRSLSKISQSFRSNYKKHPKIVFGNSIRWNANITKLIKSQNAQAKQKEAGEIYKWILMMIPVTSLGLGCWQVYRLQWKMQLIDMLQSISQSTPVDLPEDFQELEKMEYKPLKVRGKFIHEKEMLIGPRALIEEDKAMRSGSLVSDPKRNQGWLVVTPFILADSGQVILVNRGWVHQSMKSKEKRQPSFINNEIELVGVVRLSEKRAPFMPKNIPEKGTWLFRDLELMSAYIGCAPVWLDARGIPDPPEGWPIPNQTRVTLRNEHLSYIVTWFSLSGITAVMWHRYFIKKLPLL